MNKLVQDLAEHCDFYVGNEHYDKSYEEKQRLFMEKFAELIVEECVNQCRQEWYDLNNAEHVDSDARSIGIKIGQKNGVLKAMSRIKKHFGVVQYNEQEAMDRAGDEIARDIDRQVILQAGLIHEGGGYSLSTHEKQAEFAAKRNYTYSDIVSDGGMDPRK